MKKLTEDQLGEVVACTTLIIQVIAAVVYACFDVSPLTCVLILTSPYLAYLLILNLTELLKAFNLAKRSCKNVWNKIKGLSGGDS